MGYYSIVRHRYEAAPARRLPGLGLRPRLTSEASIEEQKGILIGSVCPMADDPAACEEALGTYWGDMANCLFPAFIGASDACEQLGLCRRSPRTLLGDWTCDDCTSIMTRVADFMVDPTTIAEGVGILQGECFCANGSHTEECPGLVEGLAAPAMMVLSEVLKETTPELCQDIVGVC